MSVADSDHVMSDQASLDRASVDRESCDRDSTSSVVSDKLPNTNNVIRGQNDSYAVGRKIAHGRYGAVYQVLRRRDGRQFAAKLEVCDLHYHGLSMDYKVLEAAGRAKLQHFCQLVDRGKINGHFKFIVMPLLGQNLHNLRHEFQEGRFSAPTALRLGLEMLSALEELHSIGYVHRDVKPSNFVIHEEDGQTKIYMVDFGICKPIRTGEVEDEESKEPAQFRGTTLYASLAAHSNEEQSPKSDLESWFYVVIEFMTGRLPWGAYRRTDRAIVKKLKEQARTTEGAYELLKYTPRTEFRRIMKYLDGLKRQSHPDYAYIRSLIQLSMRNHDIKPDEPYDWQQEEADD